MCPQRTVCVIVRDVTHTLPELTDREREILRGIGQGKTFAEIGAELHIAERTVKHYSDAIRRKFGAPSARALIQVAQTFPDAA